MSAVFKHTRAARGLIKLKLHIYGLQTLHTLAWPMAWPSWRRVTRPSGPARPDSHRGVSARAAITAMPPCPAMGSAVAHLITPGRAMQHVLHHHAGRGGLARAHSSPSGLGATPVYSP